MGIWHSEALRNLERLPAAHRRRPAAEAGRRAGHAGRGPQAGLDRAVRREVRLPKWSTDFTEAIADPEVDIVIIAGPSETHAEMSLAALERGKHVLVEIPIAMNLEGAEAVVAAAEERGLTLGVVHPMRYRPERLPVVERIRRRRGAGQPRAGPLLHPPDGQRGRHRAAAQLDRQPALAPHHAPDRLRAVGGVRRRAGRCRGRIRHIHSVYPPLDPRTGIPMELVLVVETHDDQTIVCTGSYYSGEYLYDTLSSPTATATAPTSAAPRSPPATASTPVSSEQQNAELIAPGLRQRRAQGARARGARLVGAAGDAGAAPRAVRLGRQARRAAAARPPRHLTTIVSRRSHDPRPAARSAPRRRAGQSARGEHVHGGHPAVQAGVPAAPAARRASAEPGRRRVRGRGVHHAVHPGPGGRQLAGPVPQREHAAVGGDRGGAAGARDRRRQPWRRECGLGRGHADDPGLEAGGRRRSSPTAGCATGTCCPSCRSRPTPRR